MSMTIAEMRASRVSTRLQRTEEICLNQVLVAQAHSLNQEKQELELASVSAPNDDATKTAKPRRMSNPNRARLREIEEELEKLFHQMREFNGVLTLESIDPGEWIRWRDDHPARRDGTDDNGRPIMNPVDLNITRGWCNSTDLIEDLETYVKAWNGDPVSPEDWTWIRSNAAAGDLKRLCVIVIEMHEDEGARPPKVSSKPSRSTARPAND